MTDRAGARRVLLLRAWASAGALVGIALSQRFETLVLFQMILGFAVAGGVPASNRVVADFVPPRYQGLAVGSKQAGAMAGVLVAGLLIPFVADAWGWRSAVGVASAVVAVSVPVIALTVMPARGTSSRLGVAGSSWRDVLGNSSVRWLTGHGLIFGAALSMVFAFVPLYAVEEVGISPSAAGSVLSVMSAVAVVARVAWGGFADRSMDIGRHIRLISLLSVGAVSLVSLADATRPSLLWVGAALAGLSMEVWNSLAGSAVISAVPRSEVGRASSLVQLTFMAGNAVGPVAFGTVVDLAGSFVLGWALAAFIFMSAAAVRYRPRATTAR